MWARELWFIWRAVKLNWKTKNALLPRAAHSGLESAEWAATVPPPRAFQLYMRPLFSLVRAWETRTRCGYGIVLRDRIFSGATAFLFYTPFYSLTIPSSTLFLLIVIQHHHSVVPLFFCFILFSFDLCSFLIFVVFRVFCFYILNPSSFFRITIIMTQLWKKTKIRTCNAVWRHANAKISFHVEVNH